MRSDIALVYRVGQGAGEMMGQAERQTTHFQDPGGWEHVNASELHEMDGRRLGLRTLPRPAQVTTRDLTSLLGSLFMDIALVNLAIR